MDEYAKAKAQQLEDNAKFVEAAKLLGLEATYFSGSYTVKLNGKYLGQDTAAGWLNAFRDAMTHSRRA